MDTCYSAACMSQTRNQQRFTTSEVAAAVGISQWCRSALCGHPLPALTDNWTTVQLADTLSSQSATLALHPVAVARTHFSSG